VVADTVGLAADADEKTKKGLERMLQALVKTQPNGVQPVTATG